jgi:hypothetical protein
VTVKAITKNDLHKLISEPLPDASHTELLKSLKNIFQGLDVKLAIANSEWYRDYRVINADGEEIAPNYEVWIGEQFKQHNNDAYRTYQAIKSLDYMVTRLEGKTVYAYIPTSSDASGFIQIDIDWIVKELKGYKIFSNSWGSIPKDLSDLQFEMTSGDSINESVPCTNSRYELLKFVDMQEFLLNESAQNEIDKTYDFGSTLRIVDVNEASTIHRDVPLNELIPEKSRVKRWFDDWQNSSASESLIYNYWGFQISTNETYKAEDEPTEYYFIPTWTVKGDIPDVEIKKGDNIHSLMDKLIKFDKLIGHSFAWFFFMLHGNRINTNVAMAIAKAVANNQVSIPQNDKDVLINWFNDPYGF